MGLRSWWRKVKEDSDRKDFENGYGWAMMMVFNHRHPIEYVENYVYGHGNGDKFDVGALKALQDLRVYLFDAWIR